MSRRIWLAIVAVLGVGGLLQGQDQAPPSNYEHLKSLEWFIGEFKCEMTADKDQGAVKKGDKLTMTASRKWALNKNAIAFSLKRSTASATVSEVAGMFGWDPAAKQIMAYGFNSDGGHGMVRLSSKDGKWYSKIKGLNPEGKPFSFTTVFSEITRDSYVTQRIDWTEGGEKLPDDEKRTWTRVK
jgi:hypothetical protein